MSLWILHPETGSTDRHSERDSVRLTLLQSARYCFVTAHEYYWQIIILAPQVLLYSLRFSCSIRCIDLRNSQA